MHYIHNTKLHRVLFTMTIICFSLIIQYKLIRIYNLSLTPVTEGLIIVAGWIQHYRREYTHKWIPKLSLIP